MENDYMPLVPYWYNVGDIVNNLEIVTQTYVTNKHGWKSKAYYTKCKKCNYLYSEPKRESNLKKYGCVVCSGRKVVQGINDICTTAKWMENYLENKEESKKYTRGSNKKISMMCPQCTKYKKKMAPNTLYRNGFSCLYCSDGISYPEKFIRSLLKALGIDYFYQLSKNNFDWCESYRYDFFIPIKNIIIETNGIQHYEDGFLANYNEQVKIDSAKKNLAIKNGITKYIQLDCRESNKEWMINSIIDSGLNELLEFDCNDIDWDKIETESLKSNVFLACNLWNENNTLTTEDIGKKLNLCSATIKNYLVKGAGIGICDYTSDAGKYRRDLKKIGKPAITAKKVFYDDTIYDSIKSFANSINQSQNTVGRWLNGSALPKDHKNNVYLSAHYATDEEIKTYPRYKYIK